MVPVSEIVAQHVALRRQNARLEDDAVIDVLIRGRGAIGADGRNAAGLYVRSAGNLMPIFPAYAVSIISEGVNCR